MTRKDKKLHKHEPRKGLGQKEKKFLHLKEFSQGRPNELSLNVLEQKAASLDEQPRKRKFWGKWHQDKGDPSPLSAALPPSRSEGDSINSSESKLTGAKSNKAARHRKSDTSSAIASKGSFLGEDSRAEIAARQKRRKRYRRFSLAVVILCCVAFLGSGGYWLYQEQQRLSTSVGVLREACSLIEGTDEVTVSIDEYFQTGFNDDTIDNANKLKNSLPDVREDLESARVYAKKAETELEGSQRDKEAAEHTLATIASRETMLDAAESRLDDDVKAKQAIDVIKQAQSAIEEGNTLLARSAQVISDTTEEHVAESTEYTSSAKTKFEEARSFVEQAQEYYPAADYATLLEYISKKAEAANEAITSNEAILIQDKATAESHNDAYNAADSAATTLAESLPQDLTDLVVSAYATSQESWMQTYNNARADAATHDAYLREYLGTNS